jgi:acetamidase/formamidase
MSKVKESRVAGATSRSFRRGGAPPWPAASATPESVQWGWLDPKEPPKLTIASGDTVAIETLMHARDQIQKGTTIEQIVGLRKANPGGGPHCLTGPIHVDGAEPGDVLEIRILEIVPKKVRRQLQSAGEGVRCMIPKSIFRH